MIVTGQLVCPQKDRSIETHAGWVEVSDGRIAGINTDALHPNPDLGGEDCVIFPGFVDCHLHLPQFCVVGLHGLPLLDWLEATVFPAEARWSDAEHARQATANAVDQLFSCGTTAIFAFGTVHPQAVEAALSECLAKRIRSRVGLVLMDQQCPSYLSRGVAEQIEDAGRLVQEWPDATCNPSPVVAATLAPRFAVSCSQELLAGAGRIARSSGAFVQTHLSETEAELEVVSRLHPGSQNYTAVYEEAGLLGPRTLLGHGIWLSEEERECLRHHESVIAHCPVANSFLRSGAMDRDAYLESGMNVALGTDIGGGHHRSMVRVAQEMIATAAVLKNKPASSEEAWWQITRGNADAVGWSDVSRIEVGAEASLVVAKPDISWREYPDPLGSLLFGWDDRWIDATLSLGETVYRR
ncbi:MAG: amidohydrolase family protein [Planctomycetota bacterium]